MARKQPDLPGFEKPRQPRLKRMRVADAGHLPGGSKGIRFECPQCGHDTDWIPDAWTISENKRGLPCPKCNLDRRPIRQRLAAFYTEDELDRWIYEPHPQLDGLSAAHVIDHHTDGMEHVHEIIDRLEAGGFL